MSDQAESEQAEMSDRVALTSAEFAAWARHRATVLPYPIDITAIEAWGIGLPEPAPVGLVRFERVCAEPREAVFALLVDPAGPTETAVAVASDHEAVLFVMTSQRVSIRAVRDTELVSSIVEVLPELVAMPMGSHTIPEARWNALFQPIATKAPPRVTQPLLEAADIEQGLAEAMLASADRPVRVGVLGASAWSAGATTLGPTLASWFEYPRGAVLATVEAPRHGVRDGRGRDVRIEAYSSGAAARALTEAIGAAQRAARRGNR